MVDVQNDYCTGGGYFHTIGKDISMIKEMLPHLSNFLNDARQIGVQIFWIQQTTLPDLESESPAWLYCRTRDGKSPHYVVQGTWGHQLVEGFEPRPLDPVVQKFRFSAFTKTSLDLLLHANGVKTVLVAGVVTQGCVEATVRDASYHDYYTVVVKDCVASTSKELHEGSLRYMASRYDLLTSSEILSIWRR
jgi:nicotinamidase-related amidase